MARISVEGCVLRSMDFKEKDRIYSLVTGTVGRLDVVGRGARKSQKRFGGHLELFSRVQCTLEYKDGRDLHTLIDANQVVALPGLQAELLRFAIASYGGELFLRSSSPGQEDEYGYRVFTAWLELLSRTPQGWEEAVLRAGEVRILALRGVLPPATACGICGMSVPVPGEKTYMKLPELAMLCEECSASVARLEPVKPGVLELLIRAAEGSLIRGAVSPPERENLRGAGVFLRLASEAFLGSPLKSASFLDSLLDD
jgi:DNA repair protein RecO (recombination protein O)